jgi:hypothetical protein
LQNIDRAQYDNRDTDDDRDAKVKEKTKDGTLLESLASEILSKGRMIHTKLLTLNKGRRRQVRRKRNRGGRAAPQIPSRPDRGNLPPGHGPR